MKFVLVDPTQQATDLAVSRAPRRADLRGLRLGLVENTKANAAKLLDEVEAFLHDELAPASVTRYSVPATLPAPNEMLDAIASECDLVIEAVGD
ncbi:MAG: UGSC family (seleno)protein [Acidimicrobiales bacterium]